jgi:hypothetical protein
MLGLSVLPCAATKKEVQTYNSQRNPKNAWLLIGVRQFRVHQITVFNKSMHAMRYKNVSQTPFRLPMPAGIARRSIRTKNKSKIGELPNPDSQARWDYGGRTITGIA